MFSYLRESVQEASSATDDFFEVCGRWGNGKGTWEQGVEDGEVEGNQLGRQHSFLSLE